MVVVTARATETGCRDENGLIFRRVVVSGCLCLSQGGGVVTRKTTRRRGWW